MKELERILEKDYLINILRNESEFKEIKDIEIARHITRSKHDVYILSSSETPLAVLKETKYGNKEMKTLEFIKKHQIYSVPTLIYAGENFCITKYIKNLEETKSPFDFIEDLAKKHKEQLSLGLDYSGLIMDKDFINSYNLKTASRITRHKDLVSNFFSDTELLLKFIENNNRIIDKPLLIHGDLHGKNVMKSNSNNFIYLDFELALIERPTWDLGRLIFDLKESETEKLIEIYSNIIKSKNYDKTLEEIRRMTIVDFVYKFTNVGIGVQQHEYYKEWKGKYLENINMHFKWMVNNVN